MTTVLIVDDQALIRAAVRDLLDADADVEVTGEAVDGAQAVGLARRTRPDVVLMDIRMPVLDGIAATARICADADLADTRVLILTTFEEDEYLVQALRAGASGFIGKGAEPDEIVRAVKAVHAGESLLSPAATRSLITRYVLPRTAAESVPPALADLTASMRAPWHPTPTVSTCSASCRCRTSAPRPAKRSTRSATSGSRASRSHRGPAVCRSTTSGSPSCGACSMSAEPSSTSTRE